jgi:hypothetical protein
MLRRNDNNTGPDWMDQPDRDVEPFFSQPIRQITMMLIVLVAFGCGAYLAYPRVAPVFLASPYLNGFILAVFVVGLVACFWQVAELIRSVTWVMAFTRSNAVPDAVQPSRLLAPLATLMRARGAKTQISSTSQRSILESVATRIEEARDITRYITNLLIFLGLLGTFYGLATTVPAVVETIRSLAPQEGEGATEIFGRLMGGLEAQLGGMGTAFASSLLGLAGSLVVGLLELFASHGQNRFYRELEDWLSTITRLGYASGDSEAGSDSGVITALAEHMAEQMEALQSLYTNSDVSRSMVDERLGLLATSVDRLTQRIATEENPSTALMRIAEGQERLIELLASKPRDEGGGAHADAESRMRLRSIDVQLLRILEEMSAGRQESLTDLRADLAALTKAIRQLSRDPAVPQPAARRG